LETNLTLLCTYVHAGEQVHCNKQFLIYVQVDSNPQLQPNNWRRNGFAIYESNEEILLDAVMSDTCIGHSIPHLHLVPEPLT
jgi:hypothetical protein